MPEVHKMMLPRPLEPEDQILLREVLADEDFRQTVVSEIGSPVQISIEEKKNVVRFKSPKKTKTIWIDVLLAYTKGEVH